MFSLCRISSQCFCSGCPQAYPSLCLGCFKFGRVVLGFMQGVGLGLCRVLGLGLVSSLLCIAFSFYIFSIDQKKNNYSQRRVMKKT